MENNQQLSNTPPSSFGRELLSLLNTLVVLFVVAWLLRASVVEAFKIPSASMEPTLEIGDHILVNKLSYGIRLPLLEETLVPFRSPERGDIVVFTLPDDPITPGKESDTNIIKRVIGLPGDTIEVRGRRVIINGEVYDEDERYARWLRGGVMDFGPEVVPEGKVLLLGDNRDESRDSRFWPDHFLDIARIKGRAFIIYWNSAFYFKRMFDIIR